MIINDMNSVSLVEEMLTRAASAEKDKVSIRRYIDKITKKPALEIEIRTSDDVTFWYIKE